MDVFLSRSHTGAALIGSYKTQAYGSSLRARRRKLKVGEPTCADFSRTLSGVASSLFLVNPGAPSDRERIIFASEAPDSFVYNYKNAVVTLTTPHCTSTSCYVWRGRVSSTDQSSCVTQSRRRENCAGSGTREEARRRT